jgi:hypothetical protein
MLYADAALSKKKKKHADAATVHPHLQRKQSGCRPAVRTQRCSPTAAAQMDET